MKLKLKAPMMEGMFEDEMGFYSVPVTSKDKRIPVACLPLMLPDTYVQYLEDKKTFRQMYTKMPNWVNVSWSTCGACHARVTLCMCKSGFSIPRSIEYIYDMTIATNAGEEWGVHHPTYTGSLRDARMAVWRSGRREQATPQRLPLSTPTAPQKPVEGVVAKKLRLKKIDMASADRDVAALAAEKMGSPKRKLRRKK